MTGRKDRGRRALRPVDLARTAGVSTQQIRNYLDEGILPPAPRTPSGYRTFDERHRHALITFRALERGYGRTASAEIMRAAHAGDAPQALALVDAAHAALHEQRLALRSMGEALEAVARQDPGPPGPARSDLRIGEVAARLGVRTSALRVWESAGLLTPRREPVTGYRVFGPAEIRDAQMIHLLRQGRYPLERIGAVLDGLRRTGGSEALRAAIAERREAITHRATQMLDGSGHLYRYLAGAPDRP
ncbi:MerR family transcriptional regulator [Actinomadura rugatobispora]|uniref:MerR family transcriptional regulator n=1 Tax=Actinomadura rugatobispora TaxID=1994 RepID=A0ABW0ZU52_9ACTN|nr:MerR family transcriptional regulator [Actinomadura rugatobispora]